MADRPVEDLESRATLVAHKELAEPIRVAFHILNLASELHANDRPERISKAKRVRLLLLQRIQNDLRCCVILVERGYGLQAAALAAGIYEGWVTLANIRTEDDARKWLAHDTENKSFGPIYPLTEQALRGVVDDADQARKMYRQYQQLCMAKHQNPIIERSRGYIVLEGGGVQFRPGPDTSELGIAHSCFALERGSRIAYITLVTIADGQETSLELRAKLETRGSELNASQDECAKRWPENYSAQDENDSTAYPDRARPPRPRRHRSSRSSPSRRRR
jgi:hypothetical protein